MTIGWLRRHWLSDDHLAEAHAGTAYADTQRAHCAVRHGGVLGITVECWECARIFDGYEAIVAIIDRAARSRQGREGVTGG